MFDNKKGQFYIVAAILIIMIMSGMGSVATYAIVKSEPRTITDISEDLSRESVEIVDYGMYNDKDVNKLIENFTGGDMAEYFLKKTDNANIAFVYGNESGLNLLSYKPENTGSIRVGGTNFNQLREYAYVGIPEVRGNKIRINIKIDGKDNFYEFDKKNNKMFYFVIAKKSGDEISVENSENKGRRVGRGHRNTNS